MRPICWRVIEGIGGAICSTARPAAILIHVFPTGQRGMALGVKPGRGHRRPVSGLLIGGLLSE